MNGALDWMPLHPIGAEVQLDLSGEVSPAQIDALRQLFDERHLLAFPAQELSSEDQLRVAGWFGPVPDDRTASLYATDPGIGGMGDAELAFHSDLSCTPEPLSGISLYAVDVEDRSPPTLFVDAMAAAASLDEALSRRLENLHVENLWPLHLAVRQRREDAPEDWPGTRHPVLKPHPGTGKPILYLNASHSDRIVELGTEESEALIQELFALLYAPANRYDHHWRNGDLLVWDNLALQHARPPVPEGVARTLRRVEIGSALYQELMPPQLLAAYMEQ